VQRIAVPATGLCSGLRKLKIDIILGYCTLRRTIWSYKNYGECERLRDGRATALRRRTVSWLSMFRGAARMRFMRSNIRLSVVIPKDTDRALRAYLGKKRGKKRDISRFVDEAVQARLFEPVVRDVKRRNGAQSQKRILQAIEETTRAA
jgi:ribbon-helix-helix protein